MALFFPKLLRMFLSYGPKHPVLTKFDSNSFVADLETLISNIRVDAVPEVDFTQEAVGQRQFQRVRNDINAAAIQYSRKWENQKPKRAVQVAVKYLRDNSLLAVPFDKGCGYFVTTKVAYILKLNEILKGKQFKALQEFLHARMQKILY